MLDAMHARSLLPLAAALALGAPAAAQDVGLTPEQVELAREFSPLPDPPPDPTNAVYEDPASATGAARLAASRTTRATP